MATLFFRIGVLLGLVAVAVIAVLPLRRQLADFHELVRRTPPMQRTLLALLAAVFIAYGGTKTNQVDQAGGTNEVEMAGGGGQSNLSTVFLCATEQESNILCPPPPATSTSSSPSPLAFTSAAPVVTPEEIARGWQVWEVRTNAAVDYAMPAGAVLASNWWMRGAYEDVVRIGNGDRGTGIGEWLFPFGTNEYSSLWAFSWGKARFALASTNTEIVAVGAPMSAVPYRSRLWSAADTNGSRLVTWENFTLGRVPISIYQLSSTNYQLVSAQIELRSNGDFVTRSNEVETVCRRVDPEDWDGDGISNDRDDRPLACDGDFFGPRQSLPDGANADAYCWIEVAADANARVVFTGDGRSDLPDPDFMVRAGETNRVRLLIGKTYTIVSSQPLDVVGRSSPSIVIDGNGTREIEVVWPVTFSALEGNGSSFMMRVVPSGLGGTFSWTQHCCGLTGSGNQFWWAHERSCHCDGCFASGRYSYEGYEKDCIGGHCCCPRYDDDDPYAPQEDDGPYAAGASVGFSKAVVIFEDAYTNMPGEVVARRSTQTTLACVAHGGETGGTATFSIENGAKLMSRSGGSLPVTRFVPPKQKIEFEIVYEGRLPSDSEGDIKAKADFAERGTGTRHSTRVDRMTAVKVELESYRVALQNRCRQRHVYGVAEDVRLKSYPVLGDARWNVFINGGLVPDSPFFPVGEGFLCSLTSGVGRVVYTLGGESYSTPIRVIEPEIEVRNVRANDQFPAEAKMWDPSLVDVDPVVGESGHLLLFLDRYAAPYYVSFEGLQFVEIPDESHNCPHDRQGYYADELRGGPLSHTQGSGAGKWRTTNSQAFFGTDAAGTHEAYSQPWLDGWKSWPIPMGWGFGVEVLGRFEDFPTFQTYTLSSDGTFRIEKFGHWAERNTLGAVWVDGNLQLSPWPW